MTWRSSASHSMTVSLSVCWQSKKALRAKSSLKSKLSHSLTHIIQLLPNAEVKFKYFSSCLRSHLCLLQLWNEWCLCESVQLHLQIHLVDKLSLKAIRCWTRTSLLSSIVGCRFHMNVKRNIESVFGMRGETRLSAFNSNNYHKHMPLR